MALATRVINMAAPEFNHTTSFKESMPTLSSSSPPSTSLSVQLQSQTSPGVVVGTSSTAPRVVETKTNLSLAQLWKQVQGSNNCEDLVQPLNPILKHEIIRYGMFAGACYKAFNLDSSSKRYLNCKYIKERMLEEVGIKDSGYHLTKYIYATPEINIPIQNSTSRWIGYICVSTDEESKKLGRRDLLVAFRGTVTVPEWFTNLMGSLTPAGLDPNSPRPDVKVEAGFLSLYTSFEKDDKFASGSCREQLLSELQRLLSKYKHEEISITLTGHSMGSSLALLLGYDIAELDLNRDESNNKIPITVFSFAGPRVGNLGFKKRCEELGLRIFRIVNVNDPVTKIPGVFLNENLCFPDGKFEFPWGCSLYSHVGVEIALDFCTKENQICVHDIEAYVEFLKCPKTPNHDDNRLDFVEFLKNLRIAAADYGEIRLDLVRTIEGYVSTAQSEYSLKWSNAAKGLVAIALSTFLCYFWVTVS